MHSAVPSGTVTFLFTDIEGSTRLAQEQRASWESLRQRHHEILTAAMQAEDGFVFEIIGDAFSVAFHTPAHAVRAAALAQQDLNSEPWGKAPIRVRMGIHTGEAEAVEGHYRGYMALSTVQRVTSAAHGGQVLLSEAAFQLVQDDLPAGVGTLDLGPHRLKDLQRPQHLVQLLIPDLPSAFPAPKTLDLHPHNLPMQLTSFVGREQEIRDLMQRVGAARLITLTGIAGTGKTRLGLQVAAEVMDDFADGAWLVELASISEPGSVPQAVALALNLREQPGRSPTAVLTDFVSHRRLLILIDNCEHLLEECAALVDALLRSAPHLVVLATSREALGIAGESIYPVAPLSLPQPDAASASAVAGFDATRLFVDRMAAVQPGFTLSDQNAPAVSKIVTRVDGIPLALELAAARARGMTLEQLASRLDDRFRLLIGGSRTAPARQRTLRATIDWSHDLLAEREQALFRRLGVFVGGWTSEAARAITPDGPLKEDDVDDVLSSLVEKSLVVLDTSSSRFHMLETVREYALEQLVSSGEERDVRTRHLDYWVTRSHEPALDDYRDEVAIGLLLPDHQNLLAALSWCEHVEGGAEKALEVLCGTRYYWWASRDSRASYEMIRKIVDHPAAHVRSRPRAGALQALAHTMLSRGIIPTVMDELLESLSISREISDARFTAEAQHLLAIAECDRGDLANGLRYVDEALALAKAGGLRLLTGMILNTLGEAMRASGNLDRAQAAYEEAVQNIEQTRSPNMHSIVLLNIAQVATARRNLERARSSLLAAFDLIDQAVAADAAVIDVVAGYLAAAGAWRGAARLRGAAEAQFARTGGVRERADAMHLDPLLETARHALGDEAYAAARSEGSKLSLSQAQDEARAALTGTM